MIIISYVKQFSVLTWHLNVTPVRFISKLLVNLVV
jgi:hypothetical protein